MDFAETMDVEGPQKLMGALMGDTASLQRANRRDYRDSVWKGAFVHGENFNCHCEVCRGYCILQALGLQSLSSRTTTQRRHSSQAAGRANSRKS